VCVGASLCWPTQPSETGKHWRQMLTRRREDTTWATLDFSAVEEKPARGSLWPKLDERSQFGPQNGSRRDTSARQRCGGRILHCYQRQLIN